MTILSIMRPIRVKFSARTKADQDPRLWLSLFPSQMPHFDGVDFTFDPTSRIYDWLVVYEDLMFLEGERLSNRIEPLACARQNTLLITTEPSKIKIYGPKFTAQFGHVMSRQPPESLGHPNQIVQTPPLRWYYGRPLNEGDNTYLCVDDLAKTPPLSKTQDLSTVCSNKQMGATLHRQRYKCVMALKDRLGDSFDVFGRGIRPINDKSEAMNNYRYHVTIENNVESGYWTEKIADSFLAYCIPFYFGPANIQEVFPKEAVIPIDIFDIDGAEAIIREEIKPGSYEKRLPALLKARNMVLNDYNLMKVIAQTVKSHHAPKASKVPGETIMGRHIFRRKHPINAAKDVIHRVRINRRL